MRLMTRRIRSRILDNLSKMMSVTPIVPLHLRKGICGHHVLTIVNLFHINEPMSDSFDFPFEDTPFTGD